MKILLLAFLFLIPALSFAQIGSLFGLGPKTSGMGSVSLVHGQPTPYQVISAPASLGFIRSVEIGVGGLYFDPKLRPFGTLVLNSNGTLGEFKTSGVLPGAAQVLAVAFPIGRVRPLTLGATVFLPLSTMIRVSGSPVNYPFYPLYNDISRNFFFVLGGGYEIIDGLAVGFNLRSTTKSTTAYTLRADSTINYSANATEAKGHSRLSFSLVYDDSRRNRENQFSVGAMYRAQAGLETKISADVTAFVPVQGELTSSPSYSPAEWVLMGSFKAGERWTFSVDGSWVKWSAYKSPYGSGNINSYAIGNRQLTAGFKDIPVGRIGAEYKAARGERWIKVLTGRLGYLYHPSPVPDQVGDSNFVDNDRHTFTTGFGLGFANPWKDNDLIDIDFFWQYNWLKRREVKKSAANNIGAPGYLTGGKIFLYGAGATLRF